MVNFEKIHPFNFLLSFFIIFCTQKKRQCFEKKIKSSILKIDKIWNRIRDQREIWIKYRPTPWSQIITISIILPYLDEIFNYDLPYYILKINFNILRGGKWNLACIKVVKKIFSPFHIFSKNMGQVKWCKIAVFYHHKS